MNASPDHQPPHSPSARLSKDPLSIVADAAEIALQHRITTLMARLGTTRIAGFEPVFIDPISNLRVNLGQVQGDDSYRQHVRLIAPFQDLRYLRPFVDSLTSAIVNDFFPEAREVLGEYPTGFSIKVYSHRDASDFEASRMPLDFSIETPHQDSQYPLEYRRSLNQIWGPRFLNRMSEICAKNYREVLEPALPNELVESPHFGGISLSFRWRDAWQMPGLPSMMVEPSMHSLSTQSGMSVTELRTLIDTKVLQAIQVPAADLFRKIFFGTIFPEMIEARVGMPASVDLEVAHFRFNANPDYRSETRFNLGIDCSAGPDIHWLTEFGRDKISGEFRRLIHDEFAAFFRAHIIPALENLPPAIAEHIVGATYALKKEFAVY